MAKATSISLSKFTATVKEAVAAAVARHPKFKVKPPKAVTVSYLVRGIPVSDTILAGVTVSETQAFAREVASHIAAAHPDALGTAVKEGAILSIGEHLIVGIPPVAKILDIER